MTLDDVQYLVCARCNEKKTVLRFARTKSPLYPGGYLPLCADCLNDYLSINGNSWKAVDKLCQCADIPFIPAEWEKAKLASGSNAFVRYANIFRDKEYDDISWEDYYRQYKKLHEAKKLETALPELKEEYYAKLRLEFGPQYDEEALDYLENLRAGLLATQNVNGALQRDQALKICKVSYEIDKRISNGMDFDKLLASYDKLVKAGEFTPKNVKNLNDFDTMGELIKWLEKKGWRNQYYDNVSRDVVDETMKNIQTFNQRLYSNEPGIGEEISRRLEALKAAKESENYYDTQQTYDLDNYENDGWNDLFSDGEDDFEADVGGGDRG